MSYLNCELMQGLKKLFHRNSEVLIFRPLYNRFDTFKFRYVWQAEETRK